MDAAQQDTDHVGAHALAPMPDGAAASGGKRRSYRMPVCAVASLRWGAGYSRRYTIDNLSLGGALVLGAPAPEYGEHVRALIHAGGSSMALQGNVVRAHACCGRGFAIKFDAVPADVEDRLHDLSLGMLEHIANPVLLVVGPSVAMRRALADALRGCGWHVETAAAPLGALDVMQRVGGDLRWIVALDRLTQTSGTDFLGFVAEECPGVRRLLISRPDRHRAALRAVRSGTVDAALLQPVQKRQLEQVVGSANC